jgi:hypothetical protein
MLTMTFSLQDVLLALKQVVMKATELKAPSPEN